MIVRWGDSRSWTMWIRGATLGVFLFAGCWLPQQFLMAFWSVHIMDQVDEPIVVPDSCFIIETVFPEWSKVCSDLTGTLADFKGLIRIANAERTDYCPLLPYIFFDSASSVIPERYHVFADRAATATFNEDSIPGSSIDVYYDILNILGSRLRQNPEARIWLVGCDAGDAARGETIRMSSNRTRAIVRYLVDVWDVSPKQIAGESARNFPVHLSRKDTYAGMAENRRVEIGFYEGFDRKRRQTITATTWSLLRPVRRIIRETLVVPSAIQFIIGNPIADSMIESRSIEVIMDGIVQWHIRNFGTKSQIAGCDLRTVANQIPYPETDSLTFRLSVRSRAMHSYVSGSIAVPLKTVGYSSAQPAAMAMSRIVSMKLLLSQSGIWHDVGPLQYTILDSCASLGVEKPSLVQIIGFSSAEGEPDLLVRLTQNRAWIVANLIHNRYRVDRSGILSYGLGGGMSQFDQTTPEGRFYSRSTDVVVLRCGS